MSAFLLALAMALDAVIGEPRWLWSRLPHPAVLMGRAVGWLERRLNHPPQRLNGALATGLLVLVAGLIGLVLQAFGPIAEVLVVAVLLAHRSLIDHVRAVADGLRLSLGEGRRSVSLIVSRDTAQMDEAAVSRSALESLAENFSDGVIAPAFWYLVAGLPGILIYKVVNTADSMVGYRTPRYEAYGCSAARLDDALNWIPARLTACALALVGGQLRNWSVIRTDARKHRSPNAGWPEAALAQAQGIALAGPRVYEGVLRDLAWVNGPGKRDLNPPDIDAGLSFVWKGWGLFMGLLLAMSLIDWII